MNNNVKNYRRAKFGGAKKVIVAKQERTQLYAAYLSILCLSSPSLLSNVLFPSSPVIPIIIQVYYWSAFILSLIIISIRIKRSYYLTSKSPVVLIILLLPVIYIVSADNIFHAFSSAIRLFMLFSYALAVTLLLPARILFSTLHFIMLGLSIMYFFVLYYMNPAFTGPDWSNAENVFDYKTSIGIISALLGLFCIWMISEKRRVIISIFGIGLGFSIIFFISRSAISMIIAPVGIFSYCFFVFIRSARLPIMIVCFIIFLLALLCAFVGFEVNADLIIQLLGRDPGLTGRITIWHEGYKFIIERPIFGYGYAILDDWDGPLSYQLSGLVGYLPIRLPHLHNSWLNIALQFGLVGLLLHLVALTGMIWRAFDIYLRFDAKFGALLLTINVMILTHTISESFFMESRGQFMFFAFIMLLMPVNELHNLNRERNHLA